MRNLSFFFLLVAIGLFGCTEMEIEVAPVSDYHLAPDPIVSEQVPLQIIPPPVLPAPKTQKLEELYTVVVFNVQVKELLFSLARDASINIDIHPAISGLVTMNVIEQPLTDILDRLAMQVDIRYEFKDGTLVISKDTPYWHTYKVDYLNLSRKASSDLQLEMELGDLAAGSTDTHEIENTMDNEFWDPLQEGLENILQLEREEQSAEEEVRNQVITQTATALTDGGTAPVVSTSTRTTQSNPVVIHRASGVVNILANSRQHKEVQAFLDTVLSSVQRQVLIEATIVEVTLSNDFQAGIDWNLLVGSDQQVYLDQSFLNADLGTTPFFSLAYSHASDNPFGSAEVQLLEQFGDVRVLSSPKILAMNNQMALLKVVDEKVYFTTEKTEEENPETGVITTDITATIETLPVGLVLGLMAQIGDDDVVTMVVRPTLSRILRMVDLPDVSGGVTSLNQVPEVQVREMESVLRVANNQTVILGGLMNDTYNRGEDGLPIASDLPFFGNLFKFQEQGNEKTELAIFLRPSLVVAGAVNERNDFLKTLLQKGAGPSTSKELNADQGKSGFDPILQEGSNL